jgi:hypothetical protein
LDIWSKAAAQFTENWVKISYGELDLYISQQEHELLVCHEYRRAETVLDWPEREELAELPGHLKPARRIAYSQASANYRFEPKMADIAYQVLPEIPLSLHPGNRHKLYVRTPVWLQLIADSDALLLEYPLIEPMLSWVGSSPIQGHVCYTARTKAPSQLDKVSTAPHRVTTALTLVNETSEVLQVERFSLPVPYLSVYSLDNGSLWSETIELRFEKGSGDAAVTTGKRPPEEMGNARLLSQPRSVAQSNRIRSAIDMILS